MSTEALCVGGPMAGRWRPWDGRPVFRVPVKEGVPVGIWDYSPQLGAVEYSARVFRTPDREFHFWAPVDLTDAGVMDLLLRGYLQNCERGRGES